MYVYNLRTQITALYRFKIKTTHTQRVRKVLCVCCETHPRSERTKTRIKYTKYNRHMDSRSVRNHRACGFLIERHIFYWTERTSPTPVSDFSECPLLPWSTRKIPLRLFASERARARARRRKRVFSTACVFVCFDSSVFLFVFKT